MTALNDMAPASSVGSRPSPQSLTGML